MPRPIVNVCPARRSNSRPLSLPPRMVKRALANASPVISTELRFCWRRGSSTVSSSMVLLPDFSAKSCDLAGNTGVLARFCAATASANSRKRERWSCSSTAVLFSSAHSPAMVLSSSTITFGDGLRATTCRDTGAAVPFGDRAFTDQLYGRGSVGSMLSGH